MARKRSLGKKVRTPARIERQRVVVRELILSSEAWRYTGPFTRWNRFKGAFPGLGIATVAFTGYVIVEALFFKDSHGHEEGHGDKHH